MVKQSIKIIFIAELLVLASYFYSFSMFINMQVAFFSSLFVILGASFAYKKMVRTQVDSGSYEEQRDLLDTIEDPHELYDGKPLNETPAQELDLKQIVKEEKAKIKTFSMASAKQGARGSVSLFRLVPYLFLALGFIALKNNELLDLAVYLPSLMIGIVVGSVASKGLSGES
jgi:hypothetical protein